jgi:CRP-like cAMP-binding protein/DNA-binding NarL/FixJ family response regulator
MKKILLIEDNKEVRENTAEILELSGYTVITAPNGKKGVEEAQQEKPDLIVCDIMMPVLDGYGVLHLLSKNEATAGIPFIFLTAKTERGEIRKGMDMGADDYITKPFDKIELLSAIEGRLKKIESLKKEYQKNLDGLTNFIGDTVGKDAVKKFLEGRKISAYKKKENIYREGDMPRGLYLLTKGKVKLYKMHDVGKELITSVLDPGDYFGYMALLEETDYAETAQALEESEIAFIPSEDFYKILNNNREVAKKFLMILTKNISEQQEKLLNLAYSSVRKRVADALVKLNAKAEGKSSSISFSREDLANMVGTSTESLIRTISDFKEEKLVEVKEGKIFILDDKKLKELKN